MAFSDGTRTSGSIAVAVVADSATVTAVSAANDQMALGVMRALHSGGRRVLEDVSVVGCDDVAESAAF